jgi:hypothetical protein
MMASSSQEDSSSRTRNYGDGPPWIFTGRWSICFSYCCFHFGSNLLLFCDSNWSYSPPPFRNPDVSYISYELLYVENLVEVFLSGFLFCFFFFLAGGVIARDFILLSSRNLLPKCFQMLVKFWLSFSFGSNLLLFSDWNWKLFSSAIPQFRCLVYILWNIICWESGRGFVVTVFFGHSQGSHTCQFNESFAKVSSDANEVLLLLFYLAPIY